MPSEETVWLLGIDGEGALSTLDAIDAALATVLESMNNVAGAASGLSSIDAALSTVATSSDEASTGVTGLDEALTTVTASAEGLDEAMAQMQATVAEDTAIIDSLNEAIANLEAQLAALGMEEETTDEKTQSLGESLQAAQGQLMMVGMAGIMMGKSVYDAGIQGQQGIELVQGMAGATNQDVQNLEKSAGALGDTMDQASAGFYQVASAGYTGADATKVFTAATEAAKGAQTGLQPVSTALTSIMAAYNENADQAKTTTDQMTEAVFVGKQSFEAFASAIGPLAATGHNVGLSFAEVAAAEATMTQINPNVRQDTMELNSLFTNMDMSMDKVANTAKKLKIPFDEAHYASLNLIDKLKYLADISGGTTSVGFQKLVGGINGVKASLALLSNQGQTYTGDLQKIQNSQGATDAKFAESETTIKAHTDHMAAAFSLFSTKFMDAVGPKLIPILDNLGRAMDFLTQHMDIVIPIATGLAVILGGVLVAALWAMLAPLLSITVTIAGISAPFLLIAAVVAAVVAVVVAAIMHWGQIVGWLQGVWHGFSSWFMGTLGEIGGFFRSKWTELGEFFTGVWQGMVSHAESAWSSIQSKAQSIWGGITSNVQKGGQDLLSKWNEVWNALSHTDAGNAIGKKITESFDFIKKLDIGSGLAKTLQDQLLGPIGQQFGQVGAMIHTQLVGAIAGVMPALDNLGDSFKLIWNDISQVAGIISGAFMQSQKSLQTAFSQVDQAIAKLPWKALLTSLEQVGSLLDTAFMAAWHALSPVFAQVAQAAAFVGQAFAFVGHIIGGGFLQTLQMIGMVVGGVLLVAFSVILGAIVGLLRGIATFIQGIVTIITGIVQVFSGVIQIISGLVAFFVDLFTGHFNKLGADLGVIWGGIVTLFEGVWNIIKGIFIVTVGTILSVISGFVGTIIEFFANLASSVGIHVSDLVTGIINFFRDLPQNVMNALDALPGMIVNLWNGIITDATNAGASIVQGIANGIMGAIHFVTDAITNVTSWISSHLPHSPAKEGPLRDLALQGSLITEQIAQGMLSGMPQLNAALGKITTPISSSLTVNALPSSTTGTGSGNDQQTQLLQQAVVYLAQMVQFQQQRQGNLTMNNTIQGGSLNTQMLNQLIQVLSGYGYEGTARGVG